jgi:hypothetical protein
MAKCNTGGYLTGSAEEHVPYTYWSFSFYLHCKAVFGVYSHPKVKQCELI